MAVEHSQEPRCRVRIHIERNTKGFNWDTTVEYEWTGSARSHFNEDDVVPPNLRLEQLNRMAAAEARKEVARRKQEDEFSGTFRTS